MNESIKVIIVDDDVEYTTLLKRLFETRQEMTVVGIANSGNQALHLISQLHPEIVLLDIDMPGMNGVQTTKTIVERFPTTKVVILSAYPRLDYVEQALSCGARGFLVKGSDIDDMIGGLQAVRRGKTVLDNEPQTVLISSAQRKAKVIGAHPEFAKGLDNLDKRFRPLLPYLARGLSDKEIAKAQHLSVKTVNNYILEILRTTGCSSRTEFTFKALATGLVEIPDDLTRRRFKKS
ncbi:response regulator transcription factor [Mobiluncus mulieris]|uniref:Response regulator transcription factor n=1 Tax=Mobiluncus mulieris TaxID=2052 RepID=A0A7Y0Y3L5_9ACTO|nr:response regulator transcription factor [Mobiluncus mulieris]NMW64400.1 response regulator transcription factor [Mobiluncus mulieris]